MCTLSTSNPTTARWGDAVTLTGSGFGSGGTVILSKGAVETPLVVANWSASSIAFALPAAAPAGGDGDGAYTVTITPVLQIACTATLTVTAASTSSALTFGVTPSPAQWGTQILLKATSGNFGESGLATLNIATTATLLSTVWGPTQLTASLPLVAPAGDGTYTLKVQTATQSASMSVPISSTASAPTMMATPDPVASGGQLLLTALSGGFGLVAGQVAFKATATTPGHALIWTPSQIVVEIPASLADGSYTVVASPISGTAITTDIIVSAQAAAPAAFTSPKLTPLPVDTLFMLGADPTVAPPSVMGLLALPNALQASGLSAAAASTAARWRYELLKTQAVSAAQQAIGLDGQILSLIQLATSKVEAAEEVLTPSLISTIKQLQGDTQDLQDLASSSALTDLIGDIAKAAANALMLEELITWLIDTNPIEFWIGLFGKLIDDIASFDSSIPRTRAYIRASITGNPIDAIALATQLLATIDQEIDQFVAPLRASVADVVGGVSKAMDDVFAAFDEPLLQSLGVSGAGDVANVNPLSSLETALTNALDDLVQQIKTQIQQLLNNPIQLVEDIIVAFIVAPILALLVIGFAGGPFSAAVLAAIVLIAVEELVHLVLGWLSGPLLKEVADAKKKVTEIAGKLQALLAAQAQLLETTDPSVVLEMTSSELRELKDLLPEAWLDAVADLLGQARETVLNDAVALALSAEQALGQENATAFDAISYRYASGLPSVPQQPGGSDASLFSGAALLRDLGTLDRQRTALLDGKEMQLSQRLSLLTMLGGDETKLLQFLKDGRLLVHLTEESLLDRRTPGVYRALIEEIGVSAIFDDTAVLPDALQLPLVVTHLGPSKTRIKPSANPNAPPIELPPELSAGAQGLINALFPPPRHRHPFHLPSPLTMRSRRR